VPFRMMLSPKAVSEKRGGQCFKKAKGKGKVQVKCEASGNAALDRRLHLRVSVGRETAQAFIVHDFAQEGVCSLPEEEQQWDFAQAVDSERQIFLVTLEVSL